MVFWQLKTAAIAGNLVLMLVNQWKAFPTFSDWDHQNEP